MGFVTELAEVRERLAGSGERVDPEVTSNAAHTPSLPTSTGDHR